MLDNDICLNISKIRTAMGLSQLKLDELADLPQKTTQRIESGVPPKADRVPPICDALGVTPNRLYGYEERRTENLSKELAEAVDLLCMQGEKMSEEKQKKLAEMIRMAVDLAKP